MTNRLKELRQNRNLSQTQLSHSMHVTQSLISKFESGESKMTEDLIIQFSIFFGVSTDYFLGLTNEKLSIDLKLSIKRDTETFHTLCQYYSKLNFEQQQSILNIIRLFADTNNTIC